MIIVLLSLQKENNLPEIRIRSLYKIYDNNSNILASCINVPII